MVFKATKLKTGVSITVFLFILNLTSIMNQGGCLPPMVPLGTPVPPAREFCPLFFWPRNMLNPEFIIYSLIAFLLVYLIWSLIQKKRS